MEMPTFYTCLPITDWLLLTEQVYVLIDRPVMEKVTFNGEIYSLPERASCAARLWKNPKH